MQGALEDSLKGVEVAGQPPAIHGLLGQDNGRQVAAELVA
jgi:hypothetical protein